MIEISRQTDWESAVGTVGLLTTLSQTSKAQAAKVGDFESVKCDALCEQEFGQFVAYVEVTRRHQRLNAGIASLNNHPEVKWDSCDI